MRVAYVSPLPPQQTGIADYSAELLPHLAERLDLELFADDPHRVIPALAGRFPVHPLRALPERASSYDSILYQLGNNADYHGRIYRTLLEVPGTPAIVVLHEYVLHHLVRGLTLVHGDAAGYLEEMRYAYGRSGLALAKRSLDTGIPVDVWTHPLFERAVDASLGVIVHSETTRQRVLASRPLARIAKVPHHLSLDALPGARTLTREEARAALGLPQDAFLVASFGFITPVKRLDVALRAFARFHREVPSCRYLLVGDVSPYYDLDAVLKPELRDGVVKVGHTELADFLRYMVAVDLAVNLRYPSAGETSGTVVRLLGLGRAVVVSDDGSFAELPDACCAKVPLDETEEEALLAYLRLFYQDEALRREMGENARRHLAENHSLAGSARGYAEFLEEIVAARPEPFRPAPPLAPYPADDVLTDLIAELAAEAADLGVGEGDEELLRGLAEVVVDLDLDRAG
jgi:glycosyltransferase involved in cell wall biosynthesis